MLSGYVSDCWLTFYYLTCELFNTAYGKTEAISKIMYVQEALLRVRHSEIMRMPYLWSGDQSTNLVFILLTDIRLAVNVRIRFAVSFHRSGTTTM